MPIRIEKTLSLSSVGADLVVLPLHAKTMQKPLTLHPSLRELCIYSYPLAYSYYKNKESNNELSKGDIIYLERIEDTPVAIMVARGDIRRKFDMHSVLKCIKEIQALGLHNKYTIAFPALGRYDEDRISIKNVYNAVKRMLGNGSKTIHFVLNY